LSRKSAILFTVLALFNSLLNIDDIFGCKGTQKYCNYAPIRKKIFLEERFLRSLCLINLL